MHLSVVVFSTVPRKLIRNTFCCVISGATHIELIQAYSIYGQLQRHNIHSTYILMIIDIKIRK